MMKAKLIQLLNIELACLICGHMAQADSLSPRSNCHQTGNTLRRTKVKKLNVIQLSFGNIAGDTQAPLRSLCAVLKKDRNSVQFRVTWRLESGSFSGFETILYDRKKNTLKFYEVKKGEEYRNCNHFLFTRVTDEVLYETLLGYDDRLSHAGYQEQLSDAGFMDLPILGCGRRKLS